MKKVKTMIIFGTRPEVIKCAPLIWEMNKHRDFFDLKIINTGQHKEMTEPLLDFFEINPDIDLSIMKKNQTLSQINASTLTELDKLFKQNNPDLVIVQGDTTTVFSASLAAFYNKIDVAHLEAGLRTNNKFSPYPEELNRYFTSYISKWHFAPTQIAVDNLATENIETNVHLVGNTSIDTLLKSIDRVENQISDVIVEKYHKIDFNRKIILLTAHRRENHGKPLDEMCDAIIQIIEDHQDVEIVYPVHFNPNVRDIVFNKLKHKRIHLIDPLNYQEFIWFMNHSYIILTDSGGIQEEAPSLNKPVLVLRENTERPESVVNGLSKLVGTNKDTIVKETAHLLMNDKDYNSMINKPNPYGDGRTSERIVKILVDYYSTKNQI